MIKTHAQTQHTHAHSEITQGNNNLLSNYGRRSLFHSSHGKNRPEAAKLLKTPKLLVPHHNVVLRRTHAHSSPKLSASFHVDDTEALVRLS